MESSIRELTPSEIDQVHGGLLNNVGVGVLNNVAGVNVGATGVNIVQLTQAGGLNVVTTSGVSGVA
jgi:hypothetical protein